jgi:ribosomal-protein-alanine N-acetyltransferase
VGVEPVRERPTRKPARPARRSLAPGLRIGGPGDAACLAGLIAAVQPGAWTPPGLARELARSDGLCVWLAEESRAVAVALGRIVLDELHVLDVATAPDRRRLGAGRRVVEALLAAAAGRGCVRALLELRESNAPARALYESLGFVVDGRRPRYYPDGEGAVLMTCSLGAGIDSAR